MSIRGALRSTLRVLAGALDAQQLDRLRSLDALPTRARLLFLSLLRERLLPAELLRSFDEQVRSYLGDANDGYLFTDLRRPHAVLLSMFDEFCANVGRPYAGRNFLELGVGAGGISYVARALGFDVVATDIGHGLHEHAGQVARNLLGVRPVRHMVSTDTSLAAVMTFSNGRRADYIYARGVPFNRTYDRTGNPVATPGVPFPECCDWYDIERWQIVLEDMLVHLNPGGCLFDVGIYELGPDRARELECRLRGRCNVRFRFYSRQHGGRTLTMTDVHVVRHA